jgi:predicted nicotinamide N-methyase
MPALSRVFKVPTSSKEEITLTLHEPSLTSDNLGMKTWASSYLLSRRLYHIIDSVPELVPSDSTFQRESAKIKALELGSGTGLVGLSLAILLGTSATIHLTDLPAIVANLTHNVSLNADLLGETRAQVTTGVLDWSVVPEQAPENSERYDIILAADPLYSPEHPKWLVQTIERWLSRGLDARVVVEMPLRDAYLPQVEEFRRRMGEVGLAIVEQGEEVGYDDWEGANGDSVEVHCWWSVWGWSEKL